MLGHDIITSGASTAGVQALIQLVAGMLPDLTAAIFVVPHFPAHATSVLPGILCRSGRLLAAHAEQDEAVQTGRIYVAPPSYHLLVRRGRVALTRGPRENGHRRAVDPLFRGDAHPGKPSSFACPECGGVLWEMHEGVMIRHLEGTATPESKGHLSGRPVQDS